jgi:class 3 adenylate cyclase
LNIQEAAIKKYSRLSGYVGLLANLCAAIIIVLYFNFLHQASGNIKLSFSINGLFITIFLTFIIFLFARITAKLRVKKIRKLLYRKQSVELSDGQKRLLTEFYFNTPIFFSKISLAAWVFAGLIFPFSAIYFTGNYDFALQLFWSITFLGGTVALVLTYILNDYIIRKLAPSFFQLEDFKYYQKNKNLKLLFRLLVAFWVGGVLPLLLLYVFSNDYIQVLLARGLSSDAKMKYQISVYIAFAVSILISFFSSLYFSGNLTKPLRELLAAMEKVKKGDLNQELQIVQLDEIGSVFQGYNQMVAGLREREQIKEVFGKFVSDQVRDEILKGDLRLGGVKREATVLFCDIRNFTQFSENMEPEEVIEILNIYFDEIVRPILRNGGILDKFIGDAVMAVFGVPGEISDHAERALRSAEEMLRVLDVVNEKLKEKNIILDMGIGINSGPLIAGNVGARERMEYTVIGDTVNVASRLEGLNKMYKTRIILSEYTYQSISEKEKYDFKELDETRVKGKQKSFKIYTVG